MLPRPPSHPRPLLLKPPSSNSMVRFAQSLIEMSPASICRATRMVLSVSLLQMLALRP
jgi:hypothetical protein